MNNPNVALSDSCFLSAVEKHALQIWPQRERGSKLGKVISWVVSGNIAGKFSQVAKPSLREAIYAADPSALSTHPATTGVTAVVWREVKTEVPDADTTVLIHNAGWMEPVWMGYLDGETWRTVEGSALDSPDDPYEAPPTHWADLPEPPQPSKT